MEFAPQPLSDCRIVPDSMLVISFANTAVFCIAAILLSIITPLTANIRLF